MVRFRWCAAWVAQLRVRREWRKGTFSRGLNVARHVLAAGQPAVALRAGKSSTGFLHDIILSLMCLCAVQPALGRPGPRTRTSPGRCSHQRSRRSKHAAGERKTGQTPRQDQQQQQQLQQSSMSSSSSEQQATGTPGEEHGEAAAQLAATPSRCAQPYFPRPPPRATCCALVGKGLKGNCRCLAIRVASALLPFPADFPCRPWHLMACQARSARQVAESVETRGFGFHLAAKAV